MAFLIGLHISVIFFLSYEHFAVNDYLFRSFFPALAARIRVKNTSLLVHNLLCKPRSPDGVWWVPSNW